MKTGRNERTGEIDGYTYEVLMRDKRYKSMRVTVLGDKPLLHNKILIKLMMLKFSLKT